METPSELENAAGSQENIKITTREYEGNTIIAVDFGPTAGDPSLDILEETAIVVTDEDQYEFDIPSDADEVTINDGILTIRGEART